MSPSNPPKSWNKAVDPAGHREPNHFLATEFNIKMPTLFRRRLRASPGIAFVPILIIAGFLVIYGLLRTSMLAVLRVLRAFIYRPLKTSLVVSFQHVKTPLSFAILIAGPLLLYECVSILLHHARNLDIEETRKTPLTAWLDDCVLSTVQLLEKAGVLDSSHKHLVELYCTATLTILLIPTTMLASNTAWQSSMSRPTLRSITFPIVSSINPTLPSFPHPSVYHLPNSPPSISLPSQRLLPLCRRTPNPPPRYPHRPRILPTPHSTPNPPPRPRPRHHCLPIRTHRRP